MLNLQVFFTFRKSYCFKKMKDFKGKIVLITGGGLGIGKLMGKFLLEKGSFLNNLDIDQDNMNMTLAELSSSGKIFGYTIEVSNPGKVKETASRVKTEFGVPDVLFNNDGIIVGKYFLEHTQRDIDRTMDVNAKAPMYLTHEFIPEMIARNSGQICNIASSAGLTSNPKIPFYAATKWALNGRSDSLRLKMQP